MTRRIFFNFFLMQFLRLTYSRKQSLREAWCTNGLLKMTAAEIRVRDKKRQEGQEWREKED